MNPEVCPHCGAIVPPKAKACPECGADEKTGWSETAYADNLGIPAENFDYDKFVKEEFETPADRVKPQGIHWVWWVTALVLVALFLFFFFK